ncbi:MAG: DUF4136 domain-containing protein [Candidatus Cloacimonetes bacterium]|nr:DUF4136 domain-containing protein [Candidatus Cloacimonadota bacterium]MCF7813968.1 DUF4136 domain-containing protein [Candidatus Cloacimonadota bacterium]MCF7868812.1 DUF4136 domain-containing protein [Candidatus Cloacimonadota bacterium]MCF7884071.1 DUF4136 domain-containing protein [Candidatus Cloacimonadota bacterium]
MKKIFMILLSLLALISCSTIYVVRDYDVTADFSNFKTFRWDMTRSNSRFKNELLDKRLRHTINQELIAKGFEHQSRYADFILTYEQTTRSEKDVYVTHSYHGWRHGGWGHRNVFVDKRKEALMTLKIFDAKTDQLVWQSWASGIEVRIEFVEEIINETAEKLVEDFPPGKK